MKVLYFDCFSGISGDMTIGALLDLGIDKDLFIQELNKLNLGGYEILIEKTTKQGIAGTNFHVIINNEYDSLVKRMEQQGHFSNEPSTHSQGDNHNHNNHDHNQHNHPDNNHYHHEHERDHQHDHNNEQNHIHSDLNIHGTSNLHDHSGNQADNDHQQNARNLLDI
ncbi:MAG: DUF111 family protein, partial [Bacillota bacterium]|nr:DUF111 family protein [Bacillota bacterium]